MRKKRPRITRLDQVTISRDGDDAIIEFRDAAISTTHFRIGPEVQQMSDDEILLRFNQAIAAQIRHGDELGEYVAIEVPQGSPQVEYHPDPVDQWSPRGGVLRRYVQDGGGDDGRIPVIAIDGRDFTWDEFGRMLCSYAGWGMRIAFVPDDELDRTPRIEVREPSE